MYDVFRFVYLKSLILFGWELPRMRNFDNNDEFCFLLVVTFMVGYMSMLHTTRDPPNNEWGGSWLFYLNKTWWITEKGLPCSMVGRTGEVVQHSCVLTFGKETNCMVLWSEIPWKKKTQHVFLLMNLQADWLELHDYGELDWEPKITLGYLPSPW